MLLTPSFPPLPLSLLHTHTHTHTHTEAWQWSDWSKEPVILPEQQQQVDTDGNPIPCDEQNATTHRTCVLNTSHLNSTFNSSSGTNNMIIGVSCQFCSPGAMETNISPLPPGENCNGHSNALVGSLVGLTGVAGLCTIVGLVFACLCCREWQRRMSYSVRCVSVTVCTCVCVCVCVCVK